LNYFYQLFWTLIGCLFLQSLNLQVFLFTWPLFIIFYFKVCYCILIIWVSSLCSLRFLTTITGKILFWSKKRGSAKTSCSFGKSFFSYFVSPLLTINSWLLLFLFWLLLCLCIISRFRSLFLIILVYFFCVWYSWKLS